jgi:imidazolonepropionase-like amidohydrolase
VDDHLGKEVKIPANLSAAIIREGKKYGIPTSAHIFYLSDAKQLVAAGLHGLGHSIRDVPVDDELIKLMKQKGAWLSATTLTRTWSRTLRCSDSDGSAARTPRERRLRDARTRAVRRSWASSSPSSCGRSSSLSALRRWQPSPSRS